MANAPETIPPPPAEPRSVSLEKLTATAKLKAFRAKYGKYEVAAFFAAGFLFDIATLSRIDDTVSMVQQGAYLVLLTFLIGWEQKHDLRGTDPQNRYVLKVWRFRGDAIHFLFGSLLSSFTLLYFKSSSSFVSLGFMAVMFVLLLANESERFRSLGPALRSALLVFCYCSYLAYLVPVLAGQIRSWLFYVSLLCAALVVWILHRLERRWASEAIVARRTTIPGLAVVGLLALLYFARAIPPVPLSLQFIGVYHEVTATTEKGKRVYHLKHERPWWKIWHTGDQTFRARPGDVVFVFAQVFAPALFADSIYVAWHYDDPERGWRPMGRSALKSGIQGGRDEGYRTFAKLTRWVPGTWRAEFETEDGRTIGQIRVHVEPDERTGPRTFEVVQR